MMGWYIILSGSSEINCFEKSALDFEVHWVRLGNQTLVWTDSEEQKALTDKVKQAGISLGQTEGREIEGEFYLVIQIGRAFQDTHPEARIVVEKGRYLVVDLLPEEVNRFIEIKNDWWTVRPLAVDSVIMDIIKPEARTVVPWVKENVQTVSETTYSSYLISLVNFLTRHSLTSQFTNAAIWASDHLQSLGYKVELHPINIGGKSSYNIIADRLGGQSEVRKLVIVTAHLDSVNISGGTEAPAPGADDNASGAAGVLEIARILAKHSAKHDLKIILFGGEEQGLYGSKQYVSELPENERSRISAVLNMDMIATLNTTLPTVLLEGAPVSHMLMEELAEAAATYTSLTVQTSENPFASDHVPFINKLIPAVLTIEGTDSSNANVHTANDTLDHIHYGLALDIIRMNLAVAYKLLDTVEITPPVSGPVVAWGPNRLDSFVIGTDSTLYHKWWDVSKWWPSVTGYENMGGVCKSRPEVVAWDPNRLDSFVIGTDSALYHKWWDGSKWGPSVTSYENMGGVCKSRPEVVAWGPNRLDVFVIGTDSALYHKWWDGSKWGPSVTGYEYMGGVCNSAPTVVSWGPNRLDVFVIGTDSALYHKWWDGSKWGPSVTGYEYIGGVCKGQPRVVSWGPNRLDVFVIGTDSALYHKWWDGSKWGPPVTGYEKMGGVISDF